MSLTPLANYPKPLKQKIRTTYHAPRRVARSTWYVAQKHHNNVTYVGATYAA